MTTGRRIRLREDRVERRGFRMSPKLLYDTISRQAGTIAKAVLEGVMNAADAKASSCHITLDETSIKITDDGKGFKDRDEIERNFEVFGQPHEDSEGKIYGTFRMGRGQLFAFGVNRWRTGPYEMLVDFKERGIEYDLADDQPDQRGCTVEVKLYRQLLPTDLYAATKDLERMCKWMPIPVVLNGAVISKDPAGEKWDHVTDEAYIKLRETGGLHVYNLGAWVFELPSYHVGSGGEVVSRKQLKVNFARNTVQDDCPVWSKVKPFLNKKAQERIAKKPSKALTDGERQRLADLVVQGQDVEKIEKLRLFTDVTGRNWSLEQLAGKWSDGQLSVADEGDIRADRLMQAGSAFVFNKETLERFGVRDVGGMRSLLAKLNPAFRQSKTISYADLTRGLDASMLVLKEHELTARERAILSTIKGASDAWHSFNQEFTPRQIVIGSSKTANGWTDGVTYIAVGREYLSDYFQCGSPESWIAVARLLLHEYSHDGPDTETHLHTPEFYQTFHDKWQVMMRFVNWAFKAYPGELARVEHKLNKFLLRAQDIAARAARAEARASEREAAEQRKLSKATPAKALPAPPPQQQPLAAEVSVARIVRTPAGNQRRKPSSPEEKAYFEKLSTDGAEGRLKPLEALAKIQAKYPKTTYTRKHFTDRMWAIAQQRQRTGAELEAIQAGKRAKRRDAARRGAATRSRRRATA